MAELSYDLLELISSDEDRKDTPVVSKSTQKEVIPSSDKTIAKSTPAFYIQKFIVDNTELPIGKGNSQTPDGKYGPMTHDSLRRMLMSSHTNQDVKRVVDALNASGYVGATYQDTVANLPRIAAIISGKGQARQKGEIAAPKEEFVIPLTIGDKTVPFDLAVVLRGTGDLEYNLGLVGLLDRRAPVADKIVQLEHAIAVLMQSVSPNLAGAREKIQTLGQALEAHYKKQQLEGGGNVMEFLRNKLPYDMSIIPKGSDLEKRLASWIFQLRTNMISEPTPAAQILNMSALTNNLSAIQHFLDTVRRRLEGGI